jgi:hypothetical protein
MIRAGWNESVWRGNEPMTLPTESVVVTDRREMRARPRRNWPLWLSLGISTALVLPLAVVLCRPTIAHLAYFPQEGDVVFQSLPYDPLVVAIEGATDSPFSHCGLVARRNGRWIVIEAYGGVEETPLWSWLARGRGGGFAAYRLRPQHAQQIPQMIANARKMLGRPYDARYRWDDEQIYCSELVGKAFEQAAATPLGKRVRLGDLRWQRYRQTIERIEGGSVPLDREMITPRDLAAAEKLQETIRYGL